MTLQCRADTAGRRCRRWRRRAIQNFDGREDYERRHAWSGRTEWNGNADPDSTPVASSQSPGPSPSVLCGLRAIFLTTPVLCLSQDSIDRADGRKRQQVCGAGVRLLVLAPVLCLSPAGRLWVLIVHLQAGPSRLYTRHIHGPLCLV
jgi:hypothetical protein